MIPLASKLITVLKVIIPTQFHPSFIIHRKILTVCQNRIISGPFIGLVFPHSTAPTKYLLGTYELELNPIIEKLCSRTYASIIDIGAELGYYAIGFAIRNPTARIIAFETTQDCHPLLKQTAIANGVEERVTILATCDTNSLKQVLSNQKKHLIFIDCEGEELSLLDPQRIPKLAHCDIVVELHEFIHPSIATIIRRRFSRTHRITEVWTRPRSLTDLPPIFRRLPLAVVPLRKYFLQNMDEKRPEAMRWYHLTPISSASNE